MTNNPFMPNSAGTTPTAPAPAAMPGAAPAPTQSAPTGTMNFQIDLTNVSDTIPEGVYLATCTDVDQQVSKGGNPMLVWTFTIANGPHQGKEFKNFTALTPAAMWKVAETVEALGIGQVGGVVSFARSDVIGKTCGLKIEDDDYNGRKQSRISNVLPAAEATNAN